MSPQFQVALLRGVIGSVIMAGVAFFSVWGSSGMLHPAEIAAGAALFAQLAIRGVAEGWIDTAAASNTPQAMA